MNIRLVLTALLVAGSVTLFPSTSSAQVADSTVWSLFAATTSTCVTTSNVVADTNILGPAAGWVKASYNANGQRCNLGAAGWPASETDTAANRYVEFSTAAALGRSLTVTAVSFNYGGASSTNAVRAQVFYSVDNWKTKVLMTTDSSLNYPNSTMSPYAKTLNVKVPVNQKFAFRVYPFWVSATAGTSSKYATLNTVVISGTTQSATGVASNPVASPSTFDLMQNYPNPFNPTTRLNFSLGTRGFTTLTVSDILGNIVATLVSDVKEAGTYSVNFNASALPSGMYFSTLSSGGKSVSKKMILMK